MEKIRRGNEEFIKEKGPKYFQGLTQGQQPSFGHLECSDSRSDFTTLTKLGLGNSFDLGANAGNVISRGNKQLVANLTYWLNHLQPEHKIFAIIGHTECGAVKALDHQDHLEEAIRDHVKGMLRAKRFVEKHASKIPDVERHRAIAEANVLLQMANAMKIPIVSEAVRSGKLEIAPFIHEMHTGRLTGFDVLAKHDLLAKAAKRFSVESLLKA